MNRRIVGVLAIALTALTLHGVSLKDSLNPAAATDEIVLGEWHLGYKECKAYAELHGIPMFGIYVKTTCTHCSVFIQALQSEVFQEFLRTDPLGKIVLYCGSYDEAGTPDTGTGAACNFYMRYPDGTTLPNLPGVGITWTADSELKVDYREWGDNITGPNMPDDAARNIIAKIKEKLVGYVPPSTYSGGDFLVGNVPNDRLELEIGKTDWVDVPLIRTNGVERTGENLLKIQLNGADVAVSNVAWQAGQSEAMVRVLKPTGVKAGDVITLRLLKGSGEEVATSGIAVVGPQANSASNPHWLGQRSADGVGLPQLGFGEWTMDFAVATDMVARTSVDKAYTLAVFTGALWCPHCKGLERQVFETDAFRQWAVNRHVALVAFDNPRRSATDDSTKGVRSTVPDGPPPTLLRYALGSANNVGGVPTRFASGAQYLSRNMVNTNDAEAVLRRNHAFGYETYRRPQDFRTGYPSVLVFDRNGRVAGRMAFTETSTTTDAVGDTIGVFDVEATRQRLDELLGLADADLSEESNGHCTTTTNVLSVVSSPRASATLDANDLVDVYRIADRDVRILATVRGTAAATGRVSLVQVSGGTESELAAAEGDLMAEGGVRLAASYNGGDVFLKVELTDSKVRTFMKDSSVVPYSVSVEGVIVPGDSEVERVYPKSVTQVLVALSREKVYRIDGVTGEIGGEHLVKLSVGENLYRAKDDADVWLALAEAAPGAETKVLRIRLWQTGTIGFFDDQVPVAEATVTKWFRVVRRDGASGAAKAKVVFNPLASTAKISDGRFALPVPDGWNPDCTYDLEWEDGDDSPREFPVAFVDDSWPQDDETVVFDLKLSDDTVASVTEGFGRMTVVLTDSDPKEVGRLAIVDAEPGFAKPMTVTVEAGSNVLFRVERQDGGVGYAAAHLDLVVGGKVVQSGRKMEWEGTREASQDTVRTCELKMPTDVRSATVVLVPDPGIDVKPGAAQVGIQLLNATDSADIPRFDVSSGSLYIGVCRSVAVFESVGIDDPIGGVVSLAKTTGALPSGLKVACVKDADGRYAFTVSGTPTKTGTFTAVYQVKTSKNGVTTKGTTLKVEVAVHELTEEFKGNPAVAVSSQTFSNVPVTNAVEGIEGVSGRLSGLLTLTLTSKGKASAKFKANGKTYSYTASSWAEADSANGILHCTLYSSALGKKAVDPYLYLESSSDGIFVRFNSPVDGSAAAAKLVASKWTKSAGEHWKGVYTVQMPQTYWKFDIAGGDAYMVLKMTSASAVKAGKVTYSGCLPNGVTFSGSAVMIREDAADGVAVAALPFYNYKSGSSGHVLSGILEISPDAASLYQVCRRSVRERRSAAPCWRRTDRAENESYFAAYGGYLDTALEDCCTQDYQKSTLDFLLDPGLWSSFKYGDISDDFEGAAVRVAQGKVSVPEAGRDRVKLSYSAATGVISGTFTLPFKNGHKQAVTYKGVVLPGWGSCADCDNPLISCDFRQEARPFAAGTFWFADQDGKVKFKNGSRFVIGVQK